MKTLLSETFKLPLGDASNWREDWEAKVRNSSLKVGLNLILQRYYSDDELQVLCLELGIYYDDLSANTPRGKQRELILYLQRRNRLNELAENIVKRHPNLRSLIGEIFDDSD